MESFKRPKGRTVPSASRRRVLTSIIRRYPLNEDKDIVCTYSDIRICDERTGMNEPLVYQLSRPGQRWVAMFGSDKR